MHSGLEELDERSETVGDAEGEDLSPSLSWKTWEGSHRVGDAIRRGE